MHKSSAGLLPRIDRFRCSQNFLLGSWKHISKHFQNVVSILASPTISYHAILGHYRGLEFVFCQSAVQRLSDPSYAQRASYETSRKYRQNSWIWLYIFCLKSCVRRHAERRYAIYCFANCSIVFSGRAWLIYWAGCCSSILPLNLAICRGLSGDFLLLYLQKRYIHFPNLGDIQMAC